MKNGIYWLVASVLVAFFVMISDAKKILPSELNVVLLIVAALLLFVYLFFKYSKRKRK